MSEALSRSTRWRMLALLLAMVMVLAACGDDDEEDAGSGGAATTADGGGGSGEHEEYCEVARELAELDESFQGPFTPEGFKAFAAKLEPKVLEAQKVAPDEIKAEVGTLVKATQEIKATGSAAAFENPTVGAAEEKVDAFETKECGIEHEQEEEEEPTPQTVAADATKVDVIATEYKFALPATIKAGKTALVMMNQGKEAHVMSVFRLKEGKTIQDVERIATQGGGDPEEFTEDLENGTSTTAPPGEQAVLNFDLTAGNYGMVCFITAPDGALHLAKGMISGFAVSE